MISLAALPGGRVLAGVVFSGSASFGLDGFATAIGGADAAALLLGASGAVLWQVVVGGPGDESIRGIAPTPKPATWRSPAPSRTLQLDAESLQASDAAPKVFVAKLSR